MIPKYITFMALSRYPVLLATMGKNHVVYSFPLHACPKPENSYHPLPHLTGPQIAILAADGGDRGYFTIINNTLKALGNPYLIADVEFLCNTEMAMEIESDKIHANKTRVAAA